MKYSVDYLYSFINEKENEVDRYLVSFYNEKEELKEVEMDLVTNDNGAVSIEINEYESDELNKEELNLFYYIIDQWAINNI